MSKKLESAKRIFESIQSEIHKVIEQTKKELGKLSVRDSNLQLKFPSEKSEKEFQRAMEKFTELEKRLNDSKRIQRMWEDITKGDAVKGIKGFLGDLKDSLKQVGLAYKMTGELLGINKTIRGIERIFKEAVRNISDMEPGLIKKAQKIASLVGTEIKEGAKHVTNELKHSRKHGHDFARV